LPFQFVTEQRAHVGHFQRQASEIALRTQVPSQVGRRPRREGRWWTLPDRPRPEPIRPCIGPVGPNRISNSRERAKVQTSGTHRPDMVLGQSNRLASKRNEPDCFLPNGSPTSGMTRSSSPVGRPSRTPWPQRIILPLSINPARMKVFGIDQPIVTRSSHLGHVTVTHPSKDRHGIETLNS
jgi:hypothetical protein